MELDIARGLAVLFMIAVHITLVFSNDHVRSSVYGLTIEFLGGMPAAPVFMFILGVGIIYSRKSEPTILFKRGIIILFLGYILNMLRGSIPYSIMFYLSGDVDSLYNALDEFFYIDILQFAGLTLVFFSIVKKLRMNTHMVLFSCLVFMILNFILIDIKIHSFPLSALSGLIWGSSEFSYFPFLSWIVYPVAGYIFGHYLIRCANRSKLYFFISILSAISFLVFSFFIKYLLNVDLGFEDEFAYYHHNFFGSLIFLSFIMLWISTLYYASSIFTGMIKTTVDRWSRNVTFIYFIHWVIIGFLMILFGNNESGLITTAILTITIIIASDVLATVFVKVRTNTIMGS